MNQSRRIFFIHTLQLLAIGVAAGMSKLSLAQSRMLSEDDFEAALLAYHIDATKVDPSKHMRYGQGQYCGNCSWYKGKSTDSVAGCAMYSNDKLVYSKGWCTAWMKQG